MTKLIARLRKNEEGTTAIEYGLIAALIGIVIIGGAGLVGTSIDTALETVSTTIDTAAG